MYCTPYGVRVLSSSLAMARPTMSSLVPVSPVDPRWRWRRQCSPIAFAFAPSVHILLLRITHDTGQHVQWEPFLNRSRKSVCVESSTAQENDSKTKPTNKIHNINEYITSSDLILLIRSMFSYWEAFVATPCPSQH